MFRAPLAKSEQSLVPLGQVPSASHKSPDPHRTNSVFKTLNNRLASTSGFLLNHAAERWPSGRRRTPGKCVGGKPSRGFESLSLRHINFKTAVQKIECNPCGSRCFCAFGGVRAAWLAA